MKPSTNLDQQQYERMIKLAEIARQRYLDAGGNPKRSANDQYWSEEEKQEFLQLESKAEEDAFEEEGIRLWLQLREELKEDYEVYY